jgi:NAD(P)-dependent dehydrogenase (short-subunit alcohol dehydrogenase family)
VKDDMVDLHGRTAIITGAARGLGRCHALRFAELGANVVVNDNGAGPDGAGADGSPAQDVVDEITANGGSAVAHIGSVSDFAAAAGLVALAVERFGGLDILVNNAGILRDKTIAAMSEAEWDTIMDVHLKGHFAPLHHAARYWREQTKAGKQVAASVINTSSSSGLFGNPGQVNYSAAKAGILAMTQVAALELARYGVRVNAIAPGARTRLTLATPGLGEIVAKVEGSFDRWAPENVTPLVAWLACDECDITGQAFSIIGGHIGWNKGWHEEISLDHADRAWREDEFAKALSDAGVPKTYVIPQPITGD